MTISRTAYNTTTHEGYVTRKSQEALRAAQATGALLVAGDHMVVLQDGDNYRDAVPAFVHPLEFDGMISNEKRKMLAVDVRQFGSWSRSQNQFVVRNTMEAKFALLRLQLNRVWLDESPTYLRNISALPMKVYANWISESITRRFALEPLGQMRLTILAAIMYNSLFTDAAELSEDEKMKTSGAMARELNIKQTDILEVMDQYSVLTSLKQFCNVAADAAQAIQLKELEDNVGLFIAAMGGGWFGVNHKEIIAAALEHPPTWIAICATAASDRSYRNTNISRIVERQGSRGLDQNFLNGLWKMLQTMAPTSNV